MEVTGHSGEGNGIRKPRPPGRPKSSVEKKNPAGDYQEFPGEVMNGNDGKDIVSLMGSENRVTALSAEEDQVLPGEATGHSGEANDIIRSRCGRPKGSVYKKKNLAGGNQALPGEVMHVNHGDNAVRLLGLVNAVAALLEEKDKVLTGEATGRSGEGIVPKHKPGNPKGAKSKNTLAGGSQGLPGETLHAKDAGERTPRPTSTVMGSENRVTALSGEEDQVFPLKPWPQWRGE